MPLGDPKYTSPVSSRTTMTSTPSTISRLSVEASMSCGRTLAGLRLANRPISLRIFSRPVSGRSSLGFESHLYPPMQASRTLSDPRHASRDSSGNGSPASSIAAPPINEGTKSISNPRRAVSASRTRRVAAVISGPIPSPGRSATRYLSFLDATARRRVERPAVARESGLGCDSGSDVGDPRSEKAP
jgi:hypothetical protein